MVLLAVGICCVARRRRKENENHKKGDIPLEGYYNVNADGKADNVEVNTTAEYTYITTNSPSPGENEDQTAPYTTVNDKKGSRDRLMLDPADDELGDAAVLANEHVVADDVAQRQKSVTQPAIDSQHVQSAQCAVIAEVTHSTPHTPPLSSQDYATIPDKEPEEGLYDTADHESPQEADTQATPPTADCASIVKPVQEGADDTEQPPPLPAFDPEILYTQPDKTSKAKDGGYETIPDTPGPTTAEGDYESVDMLHTSTEKQPKVPSATTAHHEVPDFGYDTVPEASGPVTEGGYEAVDIPHTKTATAREAEDRKLPDKTTESRTGEPTGSIYEINSDSTLPADAPPGYEAVHYPPSSYPAQGRSPPVQSTGSDGDSLYAEPERTVEQRAAKDKADGYATVDDKGGKVAQPQRPIPADELYSTPDMSQKRNRRMESQGLMGGEEPKDTPPDTPAAVDQLYTTPDMSKKEKKQTHVSPSEEQEDKDDDDDEDATPPEVPVYQPMTGVNSK